MALKSGRSDKTVTIDRRVLRTRALLQDALIALVPERGYGAVTVEDVCRRANVGRSTFYAHYAGKDQLRDAMIEGHLNALAHQRSTTDRTTDRRPFAFSLPMLEHAHEFRSLHRALLTSGDDAIHEKFRARIRQAVRHDLAAEQFPNNGVHNEFAVRFVSGAFLAVLAWWLETSTDLSPVQVDDMFQKMATRAVDPLALPTLPARHLR